MEIKRTGPSAGGRRIDKKGSGGVSSRDPRASGSVDDVVTLSTEALTGSGDVDSVEAVDPIEALLTWNGGKMPDPRETSQAIIEAELGYLKGVREPQSRKKTESE